MAYAQFSLICLIWSASFLFMKKASPGFTPVSIGGWRVLAAAFVLGAVFVLQQKRFTLKRADLAGLLIVAFFGYVWPYCIQPLLVERHGSGFIGMTVSFVPFFTVTLALLTGAERPESRQMIGVLGALGGLLLLMKDGLSRSVPVFDLGLALSVPLSYAGVNLFIRRRMAHVPPLGLTFFSMTLAGGILAWPAVAGIRLEGASASEGQIAVVSLALLGVFGTGLGMFLFNKLIRDHGPLFAGMTTNLVPLGAVLWGWLDGEQITMTQVGSLLVVLSMVILVQYGAAVRQPVPLKLRPHDAE